MNYQWYVRTRVLKHTNKKLIFFIFFVKFYFSLANLKMISQLLPAVALSILFFFIIPRWLLLWPQNYCFHLFFDPNYNEEILLSLILTKVKHCMQGGKLSARSSTIESPTTLADWDRCSWKYQVREFLMKDSDWFCISRLKALVIIPFQTRFYHWKEYRWSHATRPHFGKG